MADSPQDLRTCPTRIDGAAALFAHRVSPARCQDRQRGRYHKCFTCVYNHAYVATHGMPVPEPVRLPGPRLEPVAEEATSVPTPAVRPKEAARPAVRVG